ncbi:MAG: alpha/beta fold hydrolase [Solirubrobacteraceae bacterium]
MARPARRTDHVLLLHGQPGSAADWTAVTAVLHGASRPLAIDRPGWGASGTPAGDLAANAAAALAALDEAGVEGASIVGHSFGATVAAWLAAHHPQRVKSLVLVAPAANEAALLAIDRWLALPIAGYLTSTPLFAGVGATLAAMPARRLIGGWTGLEDELLSEFGRALRKPSVWSAFAHEQQVLVADLPALERRLGEITAPTTILIGEHDQVVPPNSARQLAKQIPGAHLVTIERAGHLLPFNRPALLAELISRAAEPPLPPSIAR